MSGGEPTGSDAAPDEMVGSGSTQGTDGRARPELPGAGARTRFTALAIGALSLLSAALAFTASLRSSATFDEIVLVSGGVRGLETGRWEMVTDQPPLMMYVYGAAARGAVDTLPPEDRPWGFEQRWDYARALFFGLGNDTAAMLARARLVASVLAGLTVAAAAATAWWIAGPLAGAATAAVTALLPDVLAHGGVAYNDLPLALTFLLAVSALDVLVRRPSPVRAAVAAAAVAATVGVKLSALALAPVAVVLLAAEAWTRRGDRDWVREMGVAAAVGLAALYVALVVLYRGDAALTLLRFNFWRTVLHASGGHEAPAYLLGRVSEGGWWYYYPVSFLFKTPVAFQAMLVMAALVLVAAWRRGGGGVDRVAAWRGRGALVGVVVFGAFLLRSDLNAGFRYALPLLPLLAVLVGAGFARPWRSTRVRGGFFAGLLALQAGSVLTAYPHLIAYASTWTGGRDRLWHVLADSNVDWGQGLLELRAFMAEEGVESVRLSYFGSAPPEAYGIEYVALPSFFRLSVPRTPGAELTPRFTVISANNLIGLYLQGRDPFEVYRAREPYRVLGHALFVYEEG